MAKSFKSKIIFVFSLLFLLTLVFFGLFLSLLHQKEGMQSYFSFIILALVVGFFFFLAGLVIFRFIYRPIQKIVSQIQEIHQGDFTIRLDNQRENEINVLVNAINNLLDLFFETIRKVKNTNQAILQSIAQLVQENENLSQKINAQNSALEETALTLESMTESIKKNSNNSQYAKKIALETLQKAQEGEEALLKTAKTMQKSVTGTAQIKEIVKIIETISFQTNILALNAAVEAARAKEHGKGFAVVANEVRNLAQKSGENAKQISESLENIVRLIAEGDRLTKESEEKFLGIKQEIKNTNQIIEEVSQSSLLQAEGIEQISLAVSHLQEITQKNTEMIDEIFSFSKKLEMQTREMMDVVSFFKTGEEEKEQKEDFFETKTYRGENLIEWNDKYSVKIGELDNHHKKLVQMMNQLYKNVQEKKEVEVLGKIIKELIAYTKFHFAAEEKLMQQYQYPDYATHKNQHEKFVAKVLETQREFESGNTSVVSGALLNFLKDWLVNHIMIIDKKYSYFLNQKGVH